ncbi:MAG: peptidoglycan-binding protein [Coleofasciculus sp. S288]|nr:peptidoglycan-binding protein [Coleofasciculus sp. S288]
MQAYEIPATATAQIERPLLQLGSTGEAVKELQTLLIWRDTYIGAIDGLFSVLVKNAVIAYQHRVFLLKDGIVGPLTWDALFAGAPVNMPILSQGSRGKMVFTLQHLLTLTGDYRGGIDGEFGWLTRAAAQAFQRRSGLVADGIVSDRTWYFLSQVPH